MDIVQNAQSSILKGGNSSNNSSLVQQPNYKRADKDNKKVKINVIEEYASNDEEEMPLKRKLTKKKILTSSMGNIEFDPA